MIELEVHNFQSVRQAAVKVEGFAFIGGRSNIGKSAFIRAVQHALTGAVGTDFVRHSPECDRRTRGTKKCKCFSKVVVRNGQMTLTWEKGDAVNRYTVLREGSEPQAYEGLERGTPEFLLEDFPQVKVGDDKQLIQIPDQFKPIFLLDKSGMVVADALSDVARLDEINTAMSLANKDRKDASSRRKVREGDIETLKEALARYDGLDQIDLEPLVRGVREAKAKKAKAQKIDGFLDRLSGLKTSLISLGEALAPELPDSDNLEVKGSKLAQASTFLDELNTRAPELRSLIELDKVEVPEDASLTEVWGNLVRADRLLQRSSTLEDALNQVSPAEAVEVPEQDFETPFERLVLAQGFIERLTVVERYLEREPLLEGLPDLDTTGVESLFYRLQQVISVSDRAKIVVETIAKAKADLEAAQKEEADVLKELEALGVCPACTRPLGEGHALHLEAL